MKVQRTALATALILVLAYACGDDDNPPVNVDSTPPARVTDLSVDAVTATSITLVWTAPGDDGNTGTADAYVLKQSASSINETNFGSATTVAGVPAPGLGGSAESFTIAGLDSNLTYYFALRARDEAGNPSPVSNNTKWMPRGVPQHLVKTIPPSKDNTLYEEGPFSNALGEHFFAGTNNVGPDARRGLIAFAVADSLPVGAVVDSVSLRLNLSKRAVIGGLGPRSVTLKRLISDWGEGTSVADLGLGEGGGGNATTGDATWIYRFYDTVGWTTAGGDFDATVSATVLTEDLGPYVWKSTLMTGDVQGWLDTPSSNFGWILIGDESTGATARQFDSVQNTNPANRPVLTVYYTVNP